MPRLYFHQRFRAAAPPDGFQIPALTVKAALDMTFALAPLLKTYLIDEKGRLRPEVVLIVDGRETANDEAMSRPLSAHSDILVMPASQAPPPAS